MQGTSKNGSVSNVEGIFSLGKFSFCLCCRWGVDKNEVRKQESVRLPVVPLSLSSGPSTGTLGNCSGCGQLLCVHCKEITASRRRGGFRGKLTGGRNSLASRAELLMKACIVWIWMCCEQNNIKKME